MSSSTQENRPLLTGPEPSNDPEYGRSTDSQRNDHQKPDGESEDGNRGLTASFHHIDDAHQQTT